MRIEDLPTNDEWDTYSWRAVLDEYYEGTEDAVALGGVLGVPVKAEDVTAERIARVDRWHTIAGSYAEQDIVAIVELTDGTWAALTAYTDTTGWGCQQWVTWKWARSRQEIIMYGLDREGRRRLGVPLPGEVQE